MKQHIYQFIVRTGLKVLQKGFPDIHMGIPLKPTDRFGEHKSVFEILGGLIAKIYAPFTRAERVLAKMMT